MECPFLSALNYPFVESTPSSRGLHQMPPKRQAALGTPVLPATGEVQRKDRDERVSGRASFLRVRMCLGSRAILGFFHEIPLAC